MIAANHLYFLVSHDMVLRAVSIMNLVMEWTIRARTNQSVDCVHTAFLLAISNLVDDEGCEKSSGHAA